MKIDPKANKSANDDEGPFMMPFWYVRPSPLVKGANHVMSVETIAINGVTVKVPIMVNSHVMKAGDEVLGPYKKD